MKKRQGLYSRFNHKIALLLVAGFVLMPLQVMAAMPTAVDSGSSGAATSGDWLALLTGYLDKGTDLIAWGVAILGFIVLGVVTLGKFNEARKGRAEWSEVGLTAGVGTVILLFMVFLATEATKVI